MRVFFEKMVRKGGVLIKCDISYMLGSVGDSYIGIFDPQTLRSVYRQGFR